MNTRYDSAKKPLDPSAPADLDTLGDFENMTEVEQVDSIVRAALQARSPQDRLSSDAEDLFLRLADLQTIRALAGIDLPATSIGPYELLQVIGRGGMGAVYKARHRQLGKIQAVKVIRVAGDLDAALLSRFKREVRAIGALTHPNIIAAHHADVENGDPYLVMDYVDGDSLAIIHKRYKTNGQPLPIAATCELVRQAAMGIQYAHEQGIIHRDIKPGNLILDRSGVVRVLDLGLAHLQSDQTDDEATELTRGDQIIGTPDFMSPEQLRNTRSIDARTDVYSLGATLFVLLCGSVPYPSTTGDGMIIKANRILNDPVPQPQQLRSDVPGPLAAIVCKCLAKSPEQRFQTAQELVSALEPWANADALIDLQLELQSPSDRIQGSDKRAASNPNPQSHSSRRLPLQPPRRRLMAMVVGLLCLPLLAGFVIRLTVPAVGELIIESSDPDVRVVLKQVNGQGFHSLQVEPGVNKPLHIKFGEWDIEVQGADATHFLITPDRLEIGRGQPTIVHVQRRPTIDTTSGSLGELPVSVPLLIQNNAAPAISVQLNPPTAGPLQPVTSPRFANENDWTPGDLKRKRSGLVPQPASLDDLFDWQMHLIRYPSGDTVDDHHCQRHLDSQGKWIASNVVDHVVITETDSGRVMQMVPPPSDGTFWEAMRFAPSGEMIALVSQYAAAVEIRGRSGQLLHRWNFKEPFAGPGIAWMPGGQQLVIVDRSRIAMFDLSGVMLQEFRFEESLQWVADLQTGANRGTVMFIGSDGMVREWSPSTNSLRAALQITGFVAGNLAGLSVNPDREHLLTWDSNNRSMLWNFDGTQLAQCPDLLRRASWSPNGRYLIADNRTIYDANDLSVVRVLDLDADDPLHATSFDPYWVTQDEICLLSQSVGRVSTAGSLRRFHPSGRQLPSPRLPQSLSPGSASFDDNGMLLAIHASSTSPAALSRWDSSGALEQLLWTDAHPVTVASTSVAWNTRQHQVLLIDRDQSGKVLDQRGQTIRTLPIGKYSNAIWNPIGNQLAVVQYIDDQGQLIVFGEQQTPLWSSPKFAAYIPPPAWSPDGRWLAWSTFDPDSMQHWLHVVDHQDSEKPIRDIRLIEHGNDRVIAFSPDSQWLVSLREDPLNPRSQAEVMAVQLPEFQEYRKTIAVDGALTRGISWANDSRQFLAGGLLTVSPATGLQRIGTLSHLGMPGEFSWLAETSTLTSHAGRARRSYIANQQYDEFGVPDYVFWGHVDPYQANLCHNGRLALIGSAADAKQTSLVEVNAMNAFTSWTGLVFDDGQSLSFNAAGALLHAPESIERYVAHTIHYPGGRVVPVTRDDLHRRFAATEQQQSVLWVSDLSARVYGESPSVPLPLDSNAIDRLPSAASITRIDLSGLQEVNDRELVQLLEFQQLKRIDLQRVPVQTLPPLSGLVELETIDARESSLLDIRGLRGAVGLTQLDLSQTPLTLSFSQIEAIVSLANLRHLSINDTNIEPFVITELGQLKQLQRLGLIGTGLSAEDLRQLQLALPNCEILVDEVDRERSRIADRKG